MELEEKSGKRNLGFIPNSPSNPLAVRSHSPFPVAPYPQSLCSSPKVSLLSLKLHRAITLCAVVLVKHIYVLTENNPESIEDLFRVFRTAPVESFLPVL